MLVKQFTIRLLRICSQQPFFISETFFTPEAEIEK